MPPPVRFAPVRENSSRSNLRKEAALWHCVQCYEQILLATTVDVHRDGYCAIVSESAYFHIVRRAIGVSFIKRQIAYTKSK